MDEPAEASASQKKCPGCGAGIPELAAWCNDCFTRMMIKKERKKTEEVKRRIHGASE